jgi:Fur family transcriptional regulator, ferric uptake regulator
MQRATKQRGVIQEVLTDAKRPLSPNEIYIESRKRLPQISLGTVYRTLKALEDGGLIQAVPLPGQVDRYETAERAAHHHHHFQCDGCGRVFDIEGCSGTVGISIPAGFTLQRHEITLFGLCASCSVR